MGILEVCLGALGVLAAGLGTREMGVLGACLRPLMGVLEEGLGL